MAGDECEGGGPEPQLRNAQGHLEERKEVRWVPSRCSMSWARSQVTLSRGTRRPLLPSCIIILPYAAASGACAVLASFNAAHDTILPAPPPIACRLLVFPMCLAPPFCSKGVHLYGSFALPCPCCWPPLPLPPSCPLSSSRPHYFSCLARALVPAIPGPNFCRCRDRPPLTATALWPQCALQTASHLAASVTPVPNVGKFWVFIALSITCVRIAGVL